MDDLTTRSNFYRRCMQAFHNQQAIEATSALEASGVSDLYRVDESTTRLHNQNLMRLFNLASRREICLDAGCSVGRFFPMELSLFHRVIGVDLAQDSLRRASADFPDKNRVELAACSLQSLGIKSESVDALFCRAVLQYVPFREMPGVADEFHRVLRPGGIAVLHIKNSATLISKVITALGRLRGHPQRDIHELNEQEEDKQMKVFEEKVGGGYLDFYRPWVWYRDVFESAGFKLIDSFSFQYFIWRFLIKKGIAKPVERLERLVRQTPGIGRLLRNDGINCYLAFRKI